MPVSERQFNYLATFLKRESGIVISESKLYLIRTRLSPLARQFGFETLDAMIDAMQKNERGEIAAAVLDQMTTNETLFFRDEYPFLVLNKHLLPALAEKKGSLGKIKIWSAAASTGQEGYSIAMTAFNTVDQAERKVKIVGTDISARSIRYAKAGCYKQMEVQRGLKPTDLNRYFSKNDDGNWNINDAIKRVVHFQEANLVSPNLTTSLRHYGPFDIVFCRNVLIYFDLEQRKDVIDHIAQLTEIGGHLFTGAGEMVQGRNSKWETDRFENRPVWRLVARN